MLLAELKQNQIATINNIANGGSELNAKLREVGFAEGDEVEIMAYGPFSKTPLCVRLNRTLIALRPEEARFIEVSLSK